MKEQVANEGTMLEGLHFDKTFQPMRDRSKGNWAIDRESKENLERSIERGLSVTLVKGDNWCCLNSGK